MPEADAGARRPWSGGRSGAGAAPAGLTVEAMKGGEQRSESGETGHAGNLTLRAAATTWSDLAIAKRPEMLWP